MDGGPRQAAPLADGCAPRIVERRQACPRFAHLIPWSSTVCRFRMWRLWQFCRGRPAMDRAHCECHKPASESPRATGRSMGIFSEIFSWWGGNTWSNRIYTALRGKLVGTDAARQPLLRAEQGRRPARRAAPLGDLQAPGRGLAGAARMARLAALPGRRAADRGGLRAAPLAEAAPHEHDRHARGLSSAREHPRPAASVPRRPATTSPGGRAEARAPSR